MIREALTGRTITACVILVACGVTAARGWEITRFVRATTSDLSLADRTQLFRSAAETVGVSPYALVELQRLSRNSGAADGGPSESPLQLTEAFLSRVPLSSLNWLELCRRRIAAGQGTERILQAFELSSLTGRNEGYVMYRRAVTGIALWDILPDAGRRTTVNDVAQTLGELPREELAAIKQALSNQSDEMRADFRSRLIQVGVLPDLLSQRFGL